MAQVDAVTPLREIVLHTVPRVAHGHTMSLPDEPHELREPPVLFLPPVAQPSRTPQRLSLVVNLLLVVALAILLVRAVSSQQDAASTAVTPAPSTVAATQPKPQVKTQVPPECLEASELADVVISRLTRNVRDNRLALAIRDYTIASQACRRAASASRRTSATPSASQGST